MKTDWKLLSRLGRVLTWRDINALSCSNPYDLRPIVNTLEMAITKRKRHGPLVILTGERHQHSAHIALRQALLGQLYASSSLSSAIAANEHYIACGRESDYEWMKIFLEENLGFNFRRYQRGLFSEIDKNGWLQLSISNIYAKHPQASLANENWNNFCLKRKISVRFNDAADINGKLDLTDPALVELQNFARRNHINEIDVCSPIGMTWRNKIIVERAKAHISDTGAKIYIQDCGMSHIFGNVYKNYEFKDSLYAQFTRAGFNVLPVFITSPYSGIEIIPRAARKGLRQGIVLNGLAEDFFPNGDHSEEKEIEFIDKLKNTQARN